MPWGSCATRKRGINENQQERYYEKKEFTIQLMLPRDLRIHSHLSSSLPPSRMSRITIVSINVISAAKNYFAKLDRSIFQNRLDFRFIFSFSIVLINRLIKKKMFFVFQICFFFLQTCNREKKLFCGKFKKEIEYDIVK